MCGEAQSPEDHPLPSDHPSQLSRTGGLHVWGASPGASQAVPLLCMARSGASGGARHPEAVLDAEEELQPGLGIREGGPASLARRRSAGEGPASEAHR